jgi:hypothetical protein
MPKLYESLKLLPFVSAYEFVLLEEVSFHSLKELLFG